MLVGTGIYVWGVLWNVRSGVVTSVWRLKLHSVSALCTEQEEMLADPSCGVQLSAVQSLLEVLCSLVGIFRVL